MALRSYEELIESTLVRVRSIEPTTLGERRSKGARMRLLDVREPEETDLGVIPGSTLLPRGLVEKHVADHFPSDGDPLVVVCQSGKRSVLVADALQALGYTDVHYLRGGVDGWRRAGLELDRTRAVCSVGPRTSYANWSEVRAEFPIVGRQVTVMGQGMTSLLYLDHAASTHPPNCVLARYSEFMSGEYANIHRGTHLLSRNASELFDECYYVVSDFIGGDLDDACVVFLTNTTQAIDLCAHVMSAVPGKVVVTEMEHHSNDLPHRKRGPVLRCRVREDGSLDLEHLETLLRNNSVKLVSVTGASNVTGWMPPIHTIARMAHEHGALIAVDAAQLLAHKPIDVRPVSDPEHIDFLAAAGHKAYAPLGAAFLYGPRALMDAAPPYLPGGGTASRVTHVGADYVQSPDRHQGGTPNIGGVIAMAESLRFLERVGMERVREHEVEITRAAMKGMRAIEGLRIYGPESPDERLGVLSFNLDGLSDLLVAAVLSEERGIACRNGRFCAHVYMDRMLATQGGHTAEPGSSPGAVRASFGIYNTLDDVDRLLDGLQMVASRAWVGQYRVKSQLVAAEFAGRCNDRWMEAAAPKAVADASTDDFVFEQLNTSGASRCYLIGDPVTKKAALVDPRRDLVDHYLEVIATRGLELDLVIETHTHFDYLSGSRRLKDLTGCRMAMHHTSSAPCVDTPLDEGHRLLLGEIELEIWSTPGPSEDSICVLLGDRILTGATLLLDGCGRTDFEGDPVLLFRSLARLRQLPGHVQVWPARDSGGRTHSTVAEQRSQNPKLAIEDEAEFLRVVGQELDSLPRPASYEAARAANMRCL